MKEKAELNTKVDALYEICQSFIKTILQEIENLKEEMKEPVKPHQPTYNDVVEEIKPRSYFGCDGMVDDAAISGFYYATKEIAEREALRCMWLNITEYVNRRHINLDRVYSILWHDVTDSKIKTEVAFIIGDERTRFNSEAAAKEALLIFGEDNYRKMIGA